MQTNIQGTNTNMWHTQEYTGTEWLSLVGTGVNFMLCFVLFFIMRLFWINHLDVFSFDFTLKSN